jgi:hypothetical protein
MRSGMLQVFSGFMWVVGAMLSYNDRQQLVFRFAPSQASFSGFLMRIN